MYNKIGVCATTVLRDTSRDITSAWEFCYAGPTVRFGQNSIEFCHILNVR